MQKIIHDIVFAGIFNNEERDAIMFGLTDDLKPTFNSAPYYFGGLLCQKKSIIDDVKILYDKNNWFKEYRGAEEYKITTKCKIISTKK